jgi:hypothetical protein
MADDLDCSEVYSLRNDKPDEEGYLKVFYQDQFYDVSLLKELPNNASLGIFSRKDHRGSRVEGDLSLLEKS